MKNKFFLSVFSVLLFSTIITPSDIFAQKKKSPIVTLKKSNYYKEIAEGLVVVDFWAPWCGPCRRIAPMLERIASEYNDSVKVAKLNVDNYKQFSFDLGVQTLPTIIIYRDGKEVTRIEGSVGLEEIIIKYIRREDLESI